MRWPNHNPDRDIPVLIGSITDMIGSISSIIGTQPWDIARHAGGYKPFGIAVFLLLFSHHPICHNHLPPVTHFSPCSLDTHRLT
jgi:hypothetical protein